MNEWADAEEAEWRLRRRVEDLDRKLVERDAKCEKLLELLRTISISQASKRRLQSMAADAVRDHA